MYQAGRRIISHHKRHVVLGWFAVIIILLAIGGVIYAKKFLKSDTIIGTPPPAKVTEVSDGSGKYKTFDESVFTIKLPVDWKSYNKSEVSSIYLFKNTSKIPGPGVQQLQIYFDTIPTDLGVNRVLPVAGSGNRVTLLNDVSPPCQDITNSKVPGSISTPAKYGVNFLCDLGNYERDVVGTSSTDGINVVKVTGKSTGTHRIFFAYTDNGPTPNFTIFTDAVQSFQLK